MKKVKVMTVAMRDGSVWAVPVSVIAFDRAKHYASEFGGDVERSMKEDTEPLFDDDEYESQDWAVNNMNWSDVAHAAYELHPAQPLTESEKQDAWNEGEKEFEMVPVKEPQC